MFIGDEDDLPGEFKEKTYPADLHRAAAMGEVAQHYVAELDAQFRTLNHFVTQAGLSVSTETEGSVWAS